MGSEKHTTLWTYLFVVFPLTLLAVVEVPFVILSWSFIDNLSIDLWGMRTYNSPLAYVLVLSIVGLTLLGCIGVWRANLKSQRGTRTHVLSIVLKWIGYGVTATFYWVVLAFCAHIAAHDYVQFLAVNITKSLSSGYFEWDPALQVATYLSYLILFIVVTRASMRVLNKKNPPIMNRLLCLPFILLIPSWTRWTVNCVTDLGGSNCGSDRYDYQLLVPVILSTNLISIAVSVALGCLLVKFYTARKDIPI